jgi:hypothetical protein
MDDENYGYSVQSVIPNTSGAKPDNWLGTANGIADIFCRIKGNCVNNQNGQPNQKKVIDTDIPSWVWIAAGVALLAVFIIKD